MEAFAVSESESRVFEYVCFYELGASSMGGLYEGSCFVGSTCCAPGRWKLPYSDTGVLPSCIRRVLLSAESSCQMWSDV